MSHFLFWASMTIDVLLVIALLYIIRHLKK